MGRAKSTAGKGSGWHLQTARHSRARRTGKAGGVYTKRYISIGRFSTKNEAIRFKEANKKELGKTHTPSFDKRTKSWTLQKDSDLKNTKDSDGDGVPDKKD